MGTNPWIISAIWSHPEFIIVLWIMISFLSWDFSQHSLTLVHQFRNFVVLGCVQYICKFRWNPLWVFIFCFLSIYFFHITLCGDPCQTKNGVLGTSLGWVVLNDWQVTIQPIIVWMKFSIVVYSWYLIDYIYWV